MEGSAKAVSDYGCDGGVGSLEGTDQMYHQQLYPTDHSHELQSDFRNVESRDETKGERTLSGSRDDGVPPSSSHRDGFRSVVRAHLGTIFALVGAVMFASQGALVKVIADEVSPFQLGFVLLSVLIVGSTCLMIVNDMAPPKTLHHYLWLLPSGLSLSGLHLFVILSYRHMLYSDVISIVQVNIILVGIFSWIIIREPFRVSHFLLALVALAGVFCISRPTFIFGVENSESEGSGTNRLLGTVFALIVATCLALTMVTVRKQSTVGIHPYQSSFSNSSFVFVVNGILCTASGQWTCPSARVLLWNIGAGVVYFLAQTLLYLALAREKVPLVSIINTLQVVVAFVLQLIFFRFVPLWTSWVGSLLIMVACIGTLVKRSKEQDGG